MPAVIIFRELLAAEAAAGLSAHPKATIVSESGVALTLQYAPREVEHSGGAARYEILDRPGMEPLVLRAGLDARRMTCDLFVDEDQSVGYTTRPRYSAEDIIALLDTLARGSEAVALNLGPKEAGRMWHITDMSWRSEQREHGTNRVMRATISLEFTEATAIAAGVVAGGFRVPHYTSAGGGSYAVVDGVQVPLPTRYVVQSRDTLTLLSVRFYGTPAKVAAILEANPTVHARDRLEPGSVLIIPAA